MDDELKQYLIAMEERMVSSMKDFVSHRCEQVETNLLTEFHKWASPAEARNRSIASALRALDLEMEAHDDRIKNLEGRRSQ